MIYADGIATKLYVNMSNWIYDGIKREGKLIILTVIGSIHLVSERKSVRADELRVVDGRMEHRSVEQIGEVTGKEALVGTVGIIADHLQLMKHVLEHSHRRLGMAT